MASQIQLDFGGGDGKGFAAWQKETTDRRRALARKLGLPIGRKVEVELRCGQILRGRLHLRESSGKNLEETVELQVEGVVFPPGDAVRWVATD
jgi:hypothetical protein